MTMNRVATHTASLRAFFMLLSISLLIGLSTSISAEEYMKRGATVQDYEQALASPKYNEILWLIEGYTDATGPAEYNQTLSVRRAQSAYLYLVEECGIAPKQLMFVGKGESEPYDRNNPNASINRRVRISPVGG